ncbi:uncharacterized protein LOC106709850 [Papilio machaon]|uniref:uncharacterized protein LOC106709850 n=1 Tax=Papilio machaon TaxID=76193 RepID=UPI001E6651D7|nr:uncharacterized protein LOC106709850 [Papilio machaon]
MDIMKEQDWHGINNLSSLQLMYTDFDGWICRLKQYIRFRNELSTSRCSELKRSEDNVPTNVIVDLTLNNIIANGISLKEILKYSTDNASKMSYVKDKKEDLLEFDFVIYSLVNNYIKCKL